MTQGTCSVEGCDKPIQIVSRGWCSMHYARWRRHGSTETTYPNRQLTCCIEGCHEVGPGLVQHMCQKHYARWVRHGDPSTVLNEKRDLRPILEAAAVATTDECIILDAGANDRPLSSLTGRTTTASRAVWIIANGDPGELHVLHLCNGGNGANGCINIRHLYLGDNAQNVLDRKRLRTPRR